jgi:periplasmic copper chaperone A
VEIPVEGEEEPREPAAMVSLVEAEDEHGAASSDAEEPDQDVALQNTAATTETHDDGASTGLVIVALIVGGLGLITGLAALLTARRRPTA